MKSIWFHFQGYRDLPDDFTEKYDSVWVTPPNDVLCDPEMAGKYFNWNLEELEYADEMGFDGLGVNEHHSNAYGFSCSPNLVAMPLARRKSQAAIVVLGATLPLYNPAIRVAEEFALLDCVSGRRTRQERRRPASTPPPRRPPRRKPSLPSWLRSLLHN